MRLPVDKEKLNTFMVEIGRIAESEGKVYLVGGSTALLLGVREQTIDIDIKLAPEPKGVFEAIAHLKNQLSINVELASPDDFIPAIPGWEARSEFIGRFGKVDFYHYDYYGQALSKILRGTEKDLADARSLVEMGKVQIDPLLGYFEAIKSQVIRYPAIDLAVFESRVVQFANEFKEDHD